MEIGIDERRVAIEAISTLVNIKHSLIEFILRPAGVNPANYQTVFQQRDETGRSISKRKAAPLILDNLASDEETQVIRRIIQIAADWPTERFSLARNEFEARATVQKAREALGALERMEAVETEKRAHEEIRRAEERRRYFEKKEQEDAELRRIQIAQLLERFEEMVAMEDPHRRGYILQNLLNRLFKANDISVVQSFTRNDGGEQIDGAFKLGGWHYLVESRWRSAPADIRDLDGLSGQVDRSGKQTMGMFLSIHGCSVNVVPVLKQNSNKAIILFDGFDLRTVLDGRTDLAKLIDAKVTHLNLRSEPFLSAAQYLQNLVESSN